MSTTRIYHCDGPDCAQQWATSTPPPYLPPNFIESREVLCGITYLHHFCCWTCAMKFAAAQPAEETVP